MNAPDKHQLSQVVQERWAAFLSRGETIFFKKDQIIFYEHHVPIGVYLLCKGEVELRSSDPQTPVLILKPDQHPVIGLDFIQSDLLYPYSARALEDVTVVFLTRTDFLEVFSGLGRQP